jgi:hypothetical protein
MAPELVGMSSGTMGGEVRVPGGFRPVTGGALGAVATPVPHTGGQPKGGQPIASNLRSSVAPASGRGWRVGVRR